MEARSGRRGLDLTPSSDPLRLFVPVILGGGDDEMQEELSPGPARQGFFAVGFLRVVFFRGVFLMYLHSG